MTSVRPHLSRHFRHLTIVAVAALTIASCGGSDSSTPSDSDAPTTADVNDATVATAATNGDTGGDGEAPISVDASGDIAFSDDLDNALDSVGFEGIVNIAADNLDPKPEVKVDGNDAVLTFSEGTLEDAYLPCSVLGAFTKDGQTVTVVYPDGEQLCG